MATYGQIPFGCRDAFLIPYVAGVLGAAATGVTVPRIRSVEANVTRDSKDLEGNDVIVATHTFAKSMEGTIEAGGVNVAVLAVLEGGVVTTAGTTPNRIQTYKVEGNQEEAYFKLEAQAYADDAGDQHLILWKAKATNGPKYNYQQGEFVVTNCDLKAIFDESTTPSRLYTLILNETVTPIVKA